MLFTFWEPQVTSFKCSSCWMRGDGWHKCSLQLALHKRTGENDVIRGLLLNLQRFCTDGFHKLWLCQIVACFCDQWGEYALSPVGCCPNLATGIVNLFIEVFAYYRRHPSTSMRHFLANWVYLIYCEWLWLPVTWVKAPIFVAPIDWLTHSARNVFPTWWNWRWL